MHKQDAARERKQAAWSVVLTVVWMPFLVGMFLSGPQWTVLVFSLAFMAAYIVERLQLSRTIVSLILQREAPPSAG